MNGSLHRVPESRQTSRLLWDSPYLLSVTAFLTGALLQGYPPWQIGAVLLTPAVAFRALARLTGGLGDGVYRLFKIGFYGMLIGALWLRGGSGYVIPALLHALFTGFEALLAQVLMLAGQGHISVGLAVFAVMLMVVARKIGLETASVWVYWTFFRLVAPVFGLLVLISLWSHGDVKQAVLVGGSVVSLFLAAKGLYLIALGTTSLLDRE